MKNVVSDKIIHYLEFMKVIHGSWGRDPDRAPGRLGLHKCNCLVRFIRAAAVARSFRRRAPWQPLLRSTNSVAFEQRDCQSDSVKWKLLSELRVSISPPDLVLFVRFSTIFISVWMPRM